MTVIEMLESLTRYARAYRRGAVESVRGNSHMNEVGEDDEIRQRVVDAVLVDFINDIGRRCGCDYAMYTRDLGPLEDETEDEAKQGD